MLDALRGLLDEGDQGELQKGFREHRPCARTMEGQRRK
jgi:hypothetical protein